MGAEFVTKIRNIKNIKSLDFEIPTTNGLYAITGENGSGKSTIVSSIATSFYRFQYDDYFGKPRHDSYIEHNLNGGKRIIESHDGAWTIPEKNLGIIGFYEGSIVYGNRFKDIDYDLVAKLSNIKKSDLVNSETFVVDNLGLILHDDSNYYRNKLFFLNKKSAQNYGLELRRKLFYYENQGSLTSQLQMSTGENLLLTILDSLYIRINRRNTGEYPTYVLLDEIELALHSSAIRRFVFFLENLAKKYNFCIIFSTHSIEILRGISPDNIFYVQNFYNGRLNILNPCYPVYATRNLESANYGYDFVIMVEDNLAKEVVERIIIKERLRTNKKILVIPVGGWNQVLRFAYDTIRSNLVLSTTKVLIVLDRDIKSEVNSFMRSEHIGFSTPPNYLPIQSLEKYLLDKLTKNIDYELVNLLNDYIFQNTPLDKVCKEYHMTDKSHEDQNGKSFYKIIKRELNSVRKDEKELIDFVTEYLFKTNGEELQELVEFFKSELK